MSETRKIRILIADDFKILRDVIRLHLERAKDMHVVGEARHLEDALKSAMELQPDVIVTNDYLPPVDSAHAADRFRKQGTLAAILAISMFPERDLINRSFQNGVNGFMYKDEIDEFLADAIRSVHRGERYLSPKAREIYGGMQE